MAVTILKLPALLRFVPIASDFGFWHDDLAFSIERSVGELPLRTVAQSPELD